MLSPYFVVARSSGNIIRVTRRDHPPPDTETVVNLYASTESLHRYEQLRAWGHDLISLANVTGRSCSEQNHRSLRAQPNSQFPFTPPG
ncbi:hypothetical protein D9M68_186620 [compost metagenome]